MNQKLLFKNETNLNPFIAIQSMLLGNSSKQNLSVNPEESLLKERRKNFLLGIAAFGFFSSGAHMAINTTVALSQNHKSLKPHLIQTQ